MFIPVSAVFFMIGTALYAYYKTFPELLPAGVEGDAVFPYFIVHALPTGLTGLLIAPFCGGNEYGGYKHYKFGYYHSDGLLCPLYK